MCMCIYRYKSFYIGIVIVSFISIYWYIDIYRASLITEVLHLLGSASVASTMSP